MNTTTYADLKAGDTFRTISGECTVLAIVASHVPGCLTITHRRQDGRTEVGTVPAAAQVLA